MAKETLPQQEPSQDVLTFLKEEILQQFPSEKDQFTHTHRITTQIQNGNISMHVWSQMGKWIMSTEITEKMITRLEGIMSDPQKRRRLLLFTLKRETL